MKHFINYFLTEKSASPKILDVLLTIKAVKNKDGKISTADDDDVQIRVKTELDPTIDYTKTKLPQGEFLKLVFDKLLNDAAVAKKLSAKLGKDNIPYAIAIDKIEQNPQKRWKNQKEIGYLIGKEAEKLAKLPNNKVPPLTKLIYDENEDKRIIFLDTDTYLANKDIVIHQSSGSKGKKLEKEYLDLVKAKTDKDAENSNDEAPAEDAEHKTIDNKVAEEPTEQQKEEPTKSTPSIECITVVNEVINKDGNVVIPDTNIENKLTINLTDAAETEDFGNNIYVAVTKHCINNFINKVSKDIIPLTILIDDVKYNMSDDVKANIEKYFSDETIVYDSDNTEDGILTFTDKNCLLMSSQAGKAYYDKKIKTADIATDKVANSSELGKHYDKIISKKTDTNKDTVTKPAETSNTDIDRMANRRAASDLLGSIGKKTANTTSTYTAKDTELAMKILTSLGVSKDKAQQVIAKFINK